MFAIEGNQMLSRREVERLTGLSRSTLYRHMRAGLFPEPLKVGPRAVRWPAAEVTDWLLKCERATGHGEKRRPDVRTA